MSIHCAPYNFKHTDHSAHQPFDQSSDFMMVSSVASSEGDDPVRSSHDNHPLDGFKDEYLEQQIQSNEAEGVTGIDDLGSSNRLNPESSFVPGPENQSSDRLKAIQEELEKTRVPEIIERKESGEETFSFTMPSRSLKLLSVENTNKFKNKRRYPTEEREPSTQEMMRVAAAHFVQMSEPAEGELPVARDRFGALCYDPSDENSENIYLATLLLSAAREVSEQQYDRAASLLQKCCRQSLKTGNPVQRVVHYFSKALQEKVERETERLPSEGQREEGTPSHDLIQAMLTANSLQLVFHEKVPFSMILQFISMQAIIDSVASSNKIHMIDLSIRHGSHWTVLMQALADKSIGYLKISAVGTSEEVLAATGKRLGEFAETLSLPFHFKAVIASDIKDLKSHMFEVEDKEAIGIYCLANMNTMIARAERLKSFMRVVLKLKPCIMLVVDVEGKHNSPYFVNRFSEGLFHFSTWFDCLDSSMDRNDRNRLLLEEYFSEGIRSIIAMEGSDRLVRHVGINMWRSFFMRYGLVEDELKEWSPYQAELLFKQFPHGNSCTLDKNGKSFLLGWKGAPLFFISAWKFPQTRNYNPVSLQQRHGK